MAYVLPELLPKDYARGVESRSIIGSMEATTGISAHSVSQFRVQL